MGTTRRIESWEEAAERLREAIGLQPRSPAAARVAIAEWTQGDAVGSAGVVLFTDELESVRTDCSYPHLRLLENCVASSDLVSSVVDTLRSAHGGFPLVDWAKRVDVACGSWPYWELRVHPMHSTSQPWNSPAVAFGHPPWSDSAAAVNDWLGGDHWRGGYWRLALRDQRARLRMASLSGSGALHVEIDSSFDPNDLELHVAYGANLRGDIVGANRWVDGSTTTLMAPDGADYATVYLVHRLEGILHDVRVYRGPHEAVALEQVEFVVQCKTDLEAGEGEEVEYKPWIVPGNDKEKQILRTIVAFANARGGRLYIGVHDWGEPEGRGALCRAFKPADGEASPEEQARRWVRKLIQDRLAPVPRIAAYELVCIGGEPVLCVVVERGPEPPYAIGGKEFFVRRGATSRQADAADLRRLVSESEAREAPPTGWGVL